jgi:hypothetical protein
MNLRWHQITPAKGLPYHEWFIEFDQASGEPEIRSICGSAGQCHAQTKHVL